MGSLLCLLAPAHGSEEVVKGPPPGWVVDVEAVEAEEVDGSFHYRLVDVQEHAETKEVYERFVVELTNEAGVEEFSQLDFEFQPEYETLALHELTIERGGEIQDRLPELSVEILRREEGMEQSLYNGALTALVVLEDIRPGDVLSYAYTTSGANPVFAGRLHQFRRLGFSVPIGALHRRLLWDPEVRTVAWKIHLGDEDRVQQRRVGELDELLWSRQNVPRMNPEANTPAWVFDDPWLEYSDFTDWEDFGKWVLPLYSNPEPLPAELASVCEGIRALPGSDEEKIVAALRWVQRNIRYLGSFFGEHTHAPYPLEEICRRRFGDCKDKGTLMVAMLRELGYDAAPALVNTGARRAVGDYLPGRRCFDHFVVHLRFEGEDFLLDPTATYRRGRLEDLYTPDYGLMYIVRPESRGLTPVPTRGWDQGTTEISETYTIAERFGPAELKVETTATGADADYLRYYFAENSREEVTDEYTDFYGNDFPGTESLAAVEFSDDEEANRVEIVERYRIPGFWTRSEKERRWDAWVVASFLRGKVPLPAEKVRERPYAHSHPNRVRQRIEVKLTEAWDVEVKEVKIDDPAFRYRSAVTLKPKGFVMDFSYQSLASAVEPQAFGAYREAVDRLREDLSMRLWYIEPAAPAASEPVADPEEAVGRSMGLVLVGGGAAAGMLVGLLASVILWFWDPAPRAPGTRGYQGLGGWMVLPVIGCVLLPLVSLVQIGALFGNLDDMAVVLAVEEGFIGWRSYYVLSAFGNGLFTLLGVLQAVLLFRKRTSFPWIFIGLSAASVTANLMLLGMEGSLMDFDPETGSEKDVARGVGRLLVWGSYMVMSERVKATFIRRRKPMPPPLPGG